MNTNQEDRLPPFSLEAEMGLVGAVLLDALGVLDGVVTVIPTEEAFYDLRHRTIYRRVLSMHTHSRPIDGYTVAAALSVGDEVGAAGGMEHLSACMDACPSPANWSFFAEVVKDRWMLRRMVQVGQRAVTSAMGVGMEPVQPVLDGFEREVLELCEGAAGVADFSARELVLQVVEQIEAYERGTGRPGGLKTGIPYLDKMTTGLHPGNLVVIAGRPGSGKTSFMMNVVEYIALVEKVPVGVFSLEMSGEELMSRLVFQRAEGDYQRYRTGYFQNDDVEPVTKASRDLAVSPIRVSDTSGQTVMQIRATARRWKRQYGIGFIAIDYLQLMRPSQRYGTREQEVAEMSVGLKSLAKELQIPVMVLAQMNRDIEKEKKGSGDMKHHRKPELSDLRESGAVEQDADLVLMFYHPKLRDYEEEQFRSEDWSRRHVRVNGLVAKQRNGPTGDVELVFKKQCMRFEGYVRPIAKQQSHGGDDE